MEQKRKRKSEIDDSFFIKPNSMLFFAMVLKKQIIIVKNSACVKQVVKIKIKGKEGLSEMSLIARQMMMMLEVECAYNGETERGDMLKKRKYRFRLIGTRK